MSEKGLQLDSGFLRFLLSGGSAFVNAKELLEDLEATDATRAFEGSHSVARIIGHLNYWQNWFYEGATGDFQAYPVHNDLSFPHVSAEQWRPLRDQFLTRLDSIKDLCDDAELMNRPFTQGQASEGGHDERKVGETMLYTVALHNAHHYGQIITLRQQMKLWPPKAGGVTW